MIPSVSSEAESELTDAALFYVREAGAELGFAFIAEPERAVIRLHRCPVWVKERRVGFTEGGLQSRALYSTRWDGRFWGRSYSDLNQW